MPRIMGSSRMHRVARFSTLVSCVTIGVKLESRWRYSRAESVGTQGYGSVVQHLVSPAWTGAEVGMLGLRE